MDFRFNKMAGAGVEATMTDTPTPAPSRGPHPRLAAMARRLARGRYNW
jgi:hypothetical protein